MTSTLRKESPTENSSFAIAVSEGLSAKEKYLSSRYFYDARGDGLFQAIMSSPEYYLTDAEYEIFSTQHTAIISEFLPQTDIVELGAGDGRKTRVLLTEHFERGPFCYMPIDISQNSINGLKQSMQEWLPGVDVHPVAGEYLEALARLPHRGAQRVFMFLGSNIGNFTPETAIDFLTEIRTHMSDRDRLLIGFDLKKDPKIILAAYNDAGGHTRAFNLNLLRRINRELGGDFDLDQFDHYPCYDPMTGACRSFLVSRSKQSIKVKTLDERFEFAAGECIFMEISQKYSPAELKRLASNSGFELETSFTDTRSYFADQIWKPVG